LVAPLGRPSNIKWLGLFKKFEMAQPRLLVVNACPMAHFSWDANLKRKLLRAAEENDRLAQRAEQWRSTEKA